MNKLTESEVKILMLLLQNEILTTDEFWQKTVLNDIMDKLKKVEI